MPKSKSHVKEADLLETGTISSDLEVPNASDIIFRHTWKIKNYNRTIAKQNSLDSPVFRCAVNGMVTSWNVAVRFWRGPHGKKVKNPIVLCLNLLNCKTEEPGQAKVRYQFGVWDAEIRHWECCSVNRVALNLENTKDLLSIGHKDLSVLDRHVDKSGDVSIMIKIQLIQQEEERHSLSQDLARVLTRCDVPGCYDTMVTCAGAKDHEEMRVHSLIIHARSEALGNLLQYYSCKDKNIKYQLDLSELPYELLHELLRYLYSDKVESLEKYAGRLLPLACRFSLPGLMNICEKALLESLTPSNVANILLLAGQCGCEILRKAALNYCEDSEEIKGNIHIGKTLAWRVMEMVNPDLFQEACESIGSSSSNLDSPVSNNSEYTL